MEESIKRSRGITIFAWFFIATSILSFINSLFNVNFFKIFSFLPKFPLLSLVVYGWMINILQLTAGINLLQLKEWSRKLIISLQIVVLSVGILVLQPLSQRPEAKKHHESTIHNVWNNLPEASKTIYSSKKDFVSKAKQRAKSIVFFANIIVLLYFSFVIIFFTRPKIKEQFK